MKCVPVHHGIPAVLHRDEPWLHRHSENGALSKIITVWGFNLKVIVKYGLREYTHAIATHSLWQ